VVVVQSDLLDALSTRLTMSMAKLDAAIKVPTALCPVIGVKGKRLYALAHYAARQKFAASSRQGVSAGQRIGVRHRCGGGVWNLAPARVRFLGATKKRA